MLIFLTCAVNPEFAQHILKINQMLCVMPGSICSVRLALHIHHILTRNNVYLPRDVVYHVVSEHHPSGCVAAFT